MIKVYHESARQSAPDPYGARLTVIGERSTLIFEGTPRKAAAFLKTMPLGTSVAVRHAGGIRSCMNKPGLWDDVKAMKMTESA